MNPSTQRLTQNAKNGDVESLLEFYRISNHGIQDRTSRSEYISILVSYQGRDIQTELDFLASQARLGDLNSLDLLEDLVEATDSDFVFNLLDMESIKEKIVLDIDKLSSLGCKSIEEFARARPIEASSIRCIDLTSRGAKSSHAYDVATTTNLDRLKYIKLEYCNIERGTMVTLSSSPNLSRVTSLLIAGNPISDYGARGIGGSPYLENLEHLDIANTQIGAQGLMHILFSPQLHKLKTINASCNHRIEDYAANAIATRCNLPELRSINLTYTDISEEGARALARSTELENVTIALGGDYTIPQAVRLEITNLARQHNKKIIFG